MIRIPKKPEGMNFPKIISIEVCHACGKNMRIELDANLEGNHVISCPNCGHEHCRVIEKGKVTSDRWDRRNGVAMYQAISVIIWSTGSSSSTTGSTRDTFLYNSWMNGSTSAY